MTRPAPDDIERPGGVLITPECCALRRELRPLAWMVLEQVALDAVVEGGRLVAHTSARRLAEQLDVDAGTAARALRVLRDCDLLILERESGPTGRFGLAVYVLQRVDGLTVMMTPRGRSPHVVEPRMAGPHMVKPDMAKPDMAKPDMVSRQTSRSPQTSSGARSRRAGAALNRPAGDRATGVGEAAAQKSHRRTAVAKSPAQGRLEL